MMHDARTGPFAEIEFSVPTMVCDACMENIGRMLTAIPDVQTVKPKLWQKRLRVRYEPGSDIADQERARQGRVHGRRRIGGTIT